MTTTKGGSATAGAADNPNEDTAAELASMRTRFAEMEKLLADVQAASGVDNTPVPEPGEPTHGLLLACGDIVEAPNPHSTHHFCGTHELTVPVTSVFDLVR